ncbi:MAG: hemerythrin domain-containing protein [Acidobacteria bacterium]|nr:hemerythrin domain-containing protein [Acidobacteriota bacterium]
MSHPVDELMSEHRLIERMLSALQSQVLHADAKTFPVDYVAKALDFFVNFADKRHHEKEEKILFPALAAAGVPRQGGPIGMMEYEHTLGRNYLGTVRANLEAARTGSPAAIAAIREAVSEYTHLLANHIMKEDMVLFRMAQNVLYDQHQLAAMLEEFHDNDNPYLTDEFRAKYEAIVEECTAMVPAVA